MSFGESDLALKPILYQGLERISSSLPTLLVTIVRFIWIKQPYHHMINNIAATKPVDALSMPFYSLRHPRGSCVQGTQFYLATPGGSCPEPHLRVLTRLISPTELPWLMSRWCEGYANDHANHPR